LKNKIKTLKVLDEIKKNKKSAPRDLKYVSESWNMQVYKYLCIANTNAVTKNFILQLYSLHDFCIVILKIRHKLHIAVGPTIPLPPPN